MSKKKQEQSTDNLGTVPTPGAARKDKDKDPDKKKKATKASKLLDMIKQ